MGGFEERHGGGVGSIRATAGKDRRDFADFYAEYEAANGFVGMGRSFAKTGLWYVTGPITYTGQAVIKRDIDGLQGGAQGRQGTKAPSCRWSRRPASRRSVARNIYKNSDESLMAIARALREEYKAIIDAGLLLQIDDAFLATFYDVMVPPQIVRRLQILGGVSHRCDQRGNQGSAGRPYPLSRLLGQLERPAYQRRRGGRHHGPHSQAQRRRDLARNGQPAP